LSKAIKVQNWRSAMKPVPSQTPGAAPVLASASESIDWNSPGLREAIVHLQQAIQTIPTYAEGYPKTFVVDAGLTRQELQQPLSSEIQQGLMMTTLARRWLDAEGRPSMEDRSTVHGETYSVVGNDQKLTLVRNGAYLPIVSYNSSDRTLTLEEPFTEEDLAVVQQGQRHLLAMLNAQEATAAQAAAQPSAQMELG
jgi:hypothetical protein